MIKIGPSLEQTYKLLTSGMNATEVATAMNMTVKTIRNYIARLTKRKLLARAGKKNGHNVYVSTRRPYTVVGKKFTQATAQKQVDANDQLLMRSIDTTLTPEQESYLRNHRDEPRSRLAKKLGISKLRLNFCLEQMGEGA